MTQTMIETLETAFEPAAKKRTSPATLAEKVSNELLSVMPRISPELFELQRTAQVTLSEKQMAAIDKHYKIARYEQNWNKKYLNPTRVCEAGIPIFTYASVPKEQEITYAGAGKISYEEQFHFSVTTDPIFLTYKASDSKWYWGSQEHGAFAIDVKSVWNAPFTLDVCVQVPEVPPNVAELADEALLRYFEESKRARKTAEQKTNMQKPTLGVLWAPTDFACYVKDDNIPKPKKIDPALVLNIPSPERNYRHVIAAWNIGEERPFKNWLAEYSE